MGLISSINLFNKVILMHRDKYKASASKMMPSNFKNLSFKDFLQTSRAKSRIVNLIL